MPTSSRYKTNILQKVRRGRRPCRPVVRIVKQGVYSYLHERLVGRYILSTPPVGDDAYIVPRDAQIAPLIR